MTRRDDRTMDLLAWEPPQVAVGYAGDVAGRGPIGNRIARLVSRALRDARDDKGVSRSEIAAAMSEDLGRPVSVAMLDKWSSEAAEEHRIPLEAFAALIRATGAMDLLGFLPSLFGFVVIPERYQPIVELHLIDEHEAEIRSRRDALTAKLRGARR